MKTPSWRNASIAVAVGATAFSLTLSATGAGVGNGNWPAWRGPAATGVAPEANPPVKWSETENVKWKVKIPGSGTATPIIWENKVFVQTAIPTGKKVDAAPAGDAPQPPPPAAPPGGEGQGRRRGPGGGRGGQKPTEVIQFSLLCLDRQTGKTLWQAVAKEEVPHEGHHADHGFASHSPVTDGELVYAYFGSRGLHCYDMNGKLKWSADLGRMRTANGFGEGSAPALVGDLIIVKWDHEDGSYITALNKNTGKEVWKQSREERTSWSTPLIVEHGGKKEIVTTASGKIRSYEPATGKLLWECAGMTANVIPTPVADSNIVYAISGFRGNSLLAIKLGRSGDLTGTDAIAWEHHKSTPYVPSPLLYGSHLYFFANNNNVLSCFDTTKGQALIDAERLNDLGGGVYASPVAAAGRVYLTGRDGSGMVIKDGEKIEVLAANKLDDRFDASPAVAGKELFLRGHQYLYCLAEK